MCEFVHTSTCCGCSQAKGTQSIIEAAGHMSHKTPKEEVWGRKGRQGLQRKEFKKRKKLIKSTVYPPPDCVP